MEWREKFGDLLGGPPGRNLEIHRIATKLNKRNKKIEYYIANNYQSMLMLFNGFCDALLLLKLRLNSLGKVVMMMRKESGSLSEISGVLYQVSRSMRLAFVKFVNYPASTSSK